METQKGVLFIVAPHMTPPKIRKPLGLLCQILMKFEFFGTFLQKSRIPNFTEIRSMAVGPIHADGWTDEATLARMDGRRDGRT